MNRLLYTHIGERQVPNKETKMSLGLHTTGTTWTDGY